MYLISSCCVQQHFFVISRRLISSASSQTRCKISVQTCYCNIFLPIDGKNLSNIGKKILDASAVVCKFSLWSKARGQTLFTYTISIFICWINEQHISCLISEKVFAISSRKFNFIFLLIKRSSYINNLTFVWKTYCHRLSHRGRLNY